MSVSEIIQSEETQRLLERVSKIEADSENKTVSFMPLFGVYAPTDTSISTEEQLNDYLSKEKDVVADYERSIIDEYNPYNFVGQNEWYNEQESHYRTRLTDFIQQHKGEYANDITLLYLAEMKAKYIDIDSFDIDKNTLPEEVYDIVKEKSGIKSFTELAEDNYIILDTETTGFDKKADDIIELGITDINGNVLYEGMFKPDRENSPSAEAVNHISNEELQDKPTINEEWEKIKTAVAGRKIATYNLDFDKNILINAASRHGVPREEAEQLFNNSACVMLSYTHYKTGYKAEKLQNALTENGIEVTQDHRAVSDCKVTAQLIQAVRERVKEKTTFKVGDKSIDLSTIDSLTIHGNSIEREYDNETVIKAELRLELSKEAYESERYIETFEDYDEERFPTERVFDLKSEDEASKLNAYIQGFVDSKSEIYLDIYRDGEKETIYPDMNVMEKEQLDRAFQFIAQFSSREYELDYDKELAELRSATSEQLRDIGLAFTTHPELPNEVPIQATADLMSYKIKYTFNNEVYKIDSFHSLEEMNRELQYLDFSDLTEVPDEVVERYIENYTQQNERQGEQVSAENTYSIYQVKDGEQYRGLRFEDYSETAGKLGYADYDLVYQGNLDDIEGTTDKDKLRSIHFTFNMDIPEDFTGRSLSKSDVIVLNDGKQEKAYYVDRGFTEMPEFIQQKNLSLENTIDTPEQTESEKKTVTLTEHSAAIECSEDINDENFSFLENVETYRIVIPNETQTRLDVLNNVSYTDRETARKELIKMGYDEVPYDDMVSIIGENMEREHEVFAQVYESNPPYVHVEWSEHHEIKDNSDYSLSEFSHLMEKLDKEWIEKRESGDQNYEGYAKTKFIINNAYGGIDKETGEQHIGTVTCRQDIGDGDGSLAEHVKLVAEGDLIMLQSWGRENVSNYEEIEESAKGRINYVAPYIEYAVTREDSVRQMAQEQNKDNADKEKVVVEPIQETDVQTEENELTEQENATTVKAEQIVETSTHQNEKSEPQALMSIEISGEVHYFKTSKSADEIINSAQGEKALLSAQEQNEEISSAEYAEIQQSRSFTFSVDMNLDDDTAKIYSVNDGKGGIPEGERTAENTHTTEIKISKFGKTKEEVKQEQITEEKEQKPQKIEPTTSVVIGNTPYKFIKDKTYINTTASAAKEIANVLDKNNINHSGIIKGELGTITVPKAKYNEVMRLIEVAKIDLNKHEKAVKDDSGKVLLDNKEAVDEFIKDSIKNIMDSKNFINFCKSDNLFLLRKYSLNNALLVMGQNKNASYCCSAKQWQQYGRIVNKGEKGLKILCPILLSEANKSRVWAQIKKDIGATYTKEQGYGVATLPNTNVKITGYNGLYDVHFNGKPVISHADETLVKKFIDQNLLGRTVLGYKLGTVFDVSQTNNNTEYVWLKAGQFDKKDLIYGDNGKPITNRAGEYKVKNTDERKNSFKPVLSAKIDPQDKDKMNLLYDILKDVSSKNKCPVTENTVDKDKVLKEAKGYYVPSESRIVIRENMEITEKVATLLHEMAHSTMHNLTEQAKNKSTNKEKEVQAEAVACLVANSYGIDTEHESFSYISQYVESRNLDYLENSLKVIWNGARELSGKIENEIAERGLDLNLETTKEPFDQKQLSDIKKNYIEIAQDIKDITQENIHSALNSYKQSVVNEVKEQRKEELSLFDKMTSECDKIFSNAEKLEKVKTRSLQESYIGEIKAGFERLTALAQETSKIESNLKEINVPETPQQEFLSYPMNYMNKDDNFKNVSIDDKKIIAQSRFIAENYSHLLNTSPEDFKKFAVQQAENIHNCMSKNGTAVEIVNAEHYGTKILMEKGMVMHPVMAEKSFKQNEMEICMAKKKAERNGEVFPSAKTDVTIYSNLNTITAKGIAALHTSVYVGEGKQIGLAEHLAQVCTGKGLARAELCDNFFDSQMEKGEKAKRLYRAEIPPKAQEQYRQAEQESQTRDINAWKERASAVKSERDSGIEQEQEKENDHEKNNISTSELFR